MGESITPHDAAETTAMTLAKTLASALVRLAARLDPPAPVPTTSAEHDSGDTQLDLAQRMIDDMILRDALSRALGRYSPKSLPGQA